MRPRRRLGFYFFSFMTMCRNNKQGISSNTYHRRNQEGTLPFPVDISYQVSLQSAKVRQGKK